MTEPPARIVRELDVPVSMADGVVLRLNVFRPEGHGPFPVIMSAHPYGKDRLPQKRRGRYRPLPQYRLLRQPEPIQFSALTGWEAPDPVFWVSRGYAVINADLRGFGTSEGVGDVFSDQEAQDFVELIHWAGTQPWSSGKVGLDGVSYLAISQYKVAALRPPHLAAICPWEGFTDLYNDFAMPGGIPEVGFSALWGRNLRATGRIGTEIVAEQRKRPLFDSWWASVRPDLERIRVPALICASYSDQSLHTRGSFEAFRRIGSTHKWLYTHRGGKWCTYYSDEAYAVRERFFDWALKGVPNGQEQAPRVRLEIRDRGDRVYEVRHEAEPLPSGTTWHQLTVDGATGELIDGAASASACVRLNAGSTTSFSWTVDRDVVVAGPMALRLFVELTGGDDAHLFVGVRKFREGAEMTFEGSMGFERDIVTKGWLAVAHRTAASELSMPGMPVHDHSQRQALELGEVAPVDIALLPSATLFRAGDILRLDVQRRWFFRRDPIRGQFPTWYPRGPGGAMLLHTGPEYPAHILLPAARS